MNEFIEQFLVECRELVDQATDGLLALEDDPGKPDSLDTVFRAVHTLKGAAGIVEFDAMGRLLHAAEDVLASLRARAGQITPELIGGCLTCLDQVVQWLDAMEVDGEIPAGADAQADALIQGFSGPAEAAPATADAEAAPEEDWLEELVSRHPDVRATVALRFQPDRDSFMRGQDPLAILAELPGLLALEMKPAEPLPALEELDPFDCRLVFLALCAGDADVVRAHFGSAGAALHVRTIDQRAVSDLPTAARELIEAQVKLLAETMAEPSPGRAASVRRVASNVLRSLGRGPEADLAAGMDLVRLPTLLEEMLTASGASPVPTDNPVVAPPQIVTRSLRVDVERIEALVNLTGELTVAKTALGHAAALAANEAFDRAELARLLKAQHAQVDRLLAELQRSVLNIRVLPMRQVFQRFPRLVREMSASLGKPARLVMEGEDTEADKTIVESLFEPLLHVLRNAFDHGVERPGARAAAGKPPGATIALRAFREGSQVIVEVADDGGGIDVSRVRAVAARRGVAPADRLAEMSDQEAADLIFAPGFSTATEITNLSGRGVGMDAVRSAIERVGGRVVLINDPGHGATVRFKLPFTVMMTSVMTVSAGGQMFGIPLDALVETSRLRREDVSAVGQARAFVWRGRTLPLINLGESLGSGAAFDDAADAHVVIANVAGHFAGLEVDGLGERMDIMLKPMDGLLAGMRNIAGTTLLGDGQVLLVLDIEALLQ